MGAHTQTHLDEINENSKRGQRKTSREGRTLKQSTLLHGSLTLQSLKTVIKVPVLHSLSNPSNMSKYKRYVFFVHKCMYVLGYKHTTFAGNDFS